MERQRTECNVENKFNLTSSHYEKSFKDISNIWSFFSKLCQGNQNCRKGARINFFCIHSTELCHSASHEKCHFTNSVRLLCPNWLLLYFYFIFIYWQNLRALPFPVTTERARTASKPFRLTGENWSLAPYLLNIPPQGFCVNYSKDFSFEWDQL